MNSSSRRRLLSSIGASLTTVAAAGVGTAASDDRVRLAAVDVSRGEDRTAPPKVGETATVSPRVTNESGSDAIAINRVSVDGGDATYTDHARRIPAGEGRRFGAEFTPDAAGTHSVTVEAMAWTGSGWRAVDSVSKRFDVVRESTAASGESEISADETAAGSDGRVVGFYCGYNRPAGDGWNVGDIPFDRLTHLTVTFLNVEPDGTVVSEYDNWSETLRELVSASDGDTTLSLCIGGGYSGNVAEGIRTAAQRERFAASAVEMMRDHGFHGLDLNWEYPADRYADGVRNGTLLLEQLREELDAAGAEDGTHYELAITTGSGALVHEHFELDVIHSYVDYVNVMCYDYVGPWDEVHDTGHNTPLDLTKRDMRGWAEETPFAADELTLGVPFYGRPFSGVSGANDGFGQRYESVGDLIGYQTLAEEYIGDPGWTKRWDDEAKVPWLYNDGEDRFITYNGPRSMRLKGDVADRYGGSMILGLSRDTDDHALLDALIEGTR